MIATAELFPLAAGIADRIDEQIQAIRDGRPCEIMEQVTPVTAELLRFWFGRDYCDERFLNFHEGQRRAIVAVIYAHEVLGTQTLAGLYREVVPQALLQPGMLDRVSQPRHQHPKYAAKMATGTGKTWVLNALLIWQYLNRVANPEDARFTRNFLLVAPGLIVYDRLLDSFQGKERGGARDFQTSDIYATRDLFVPDTYRDPVFGFLQSSVVTKADIGTKVTGGGMIAITNWHLLAGEEDPDFVDDDAVDAPGTDIDPKMVVESFFPITPGTSGGNALDTLDRRYARGGPLQSLKDLPDLLVFNDEAHHIHEIRNRGDVTEVEWQRSLTEIAATKGHRFVQIDFSATPYNETGGGKQKRREYFPHIVVDFDLNAAMSAGLVKALALDKRSDLAAQELDFRAERDESGRVIGLSEGQRVMLRAGLTKRQKLEADFQTVDPAKYPKLMVICEDTSVTGPVEEFLKSTGMDAADILVVDSNRKGEVPKAEWDKTRERLFDVDRHTQPKVIVSVLMLREGFDVNNICVIVPLRKTEASILLEQTIGRGLRLMWRDDDAIDEQKRETRERFRKKQQPTNYFDVLFIVEHPAFAAFYDDLLTGGLAAEVDDREVEATDSTGDVETVGLREDYGDFDFRIPEIVQDAEEELVEPAVDTMALPVSRFPFDLLKSTIGRGDRFVSEDAQTRTQYGEYRVDGGAMTADGYNEYLMKMTTRIAGALQTGMIAKSRSNRYAEMRNLPIMQAYRPQLVGWLDAYIRNRLFGEKLDPLANENWRVLLLDDVANYVASTFATALIETSANQQVQGAIVTHHALSEVDSISVRTSTAVDVRKSIYVKTRIPPQNGGLERRFVQWADNDGQIEAVVRIDERKHWFLHRPYLKADGMPATYSPDFLVRTYDDIFIVETKAQNMVSDENVQRKRRAAIAWCEQINTLEPDQRDDRTWNYVILGENNVNEWHSRGATVADLLEYSRLRPKNEETSQRRLI
jgi:type III restriction enzyme